MHSLTLCNHLSCAFTNALPSTYPWNSDPFQWARGDVGLKASAAPRPCDMKHVQKFGERENHMGKNVTFILQQHWDLNKLYHTSI